MKSNQVWCATQCDGCEPENFAAAGGLAKFHRPTEEPIVGRHNDHYWKGSVIGPKVSQKVGIFPTSAVQLLDTHNGMLRSPSQRQAKKVAVPTVPGSTMPPVSFSKVDGGYVVVDNVRNSSSSYGSLGQEDERFLSSSAVGSGSGGKSLDRKLIATGAGTLNASVPCAMLMPAVNLCAGAYGTDVKNSRSSRRPCSTEMVLTTNMEIAASPTRHRNSTGSSSSQASSGFESMKSTSHQYVNVSINQIRGDSPPSRNSIHSSGSSLGSLERLDESGHSTSDVSVAQLINSGWPDSRVLSAWLQGLHFDEYAPLFLNAGYDMATVARMTPEDLIAIGITKPGHRKRLTTEIHRLNIADTWPSQKPNSVADWLTAINLAEYIALFESQNCKTVDDVMHMNWEDFEDVGVEKLGHVKRLVLAAKKLKDAELQGSKMSSSTTCSPLSQTMVISCPGRGGTGDMRPFLPSSKIDSMPHILTTFNQQSKNVGRIYLRATNSFRTDLRHSGMATSSRSAESLLSEPQASCSPGDCSYPDFYQPPVEVAFPKCNVRLENLPRDVSSSSDVIFQTHAMVHRAPQQVDEMMVVNGCSTPKRIFRKMDNGRPPTENGMMISPHADIVSNGFTRNGTAGTLPSAYDRLGSLRNKIRDGYASANAAGMGSYAHVMPSGGGGEPQQCSNLIPLTGRNHGHSNYTGTLLNHSLSPNPSDCFVFSLSKQTTAIEDGELSPAPSVDEFPPPPSPIMCEASIRNLKTIKNHPITPAAADSCLSTSQMSIISTHDVVGCSSTTTESSNNSMSTVRANGHSGPTRQRRVGSLTSIESNSSTDTLPFANENVGTIKQKAATGGVMNTSSDGQLHHQPQHSMELGSRKHVSEVFASPESKQSSPSSSKSSAVFDDLGNMLKNLTDQLDAMLSEEPGV